MAKKQGLDTIALHGAYTPDTEVIFGIGKLISKEVFTYLATDY